MRKDIKKVVIIYSMLKVNSTENVDPGWSSGLIATSFIGAYGTSQRPALRSKTAEMRS